MIRYAMYCMFGVLVIAGYAFGATSAVDAGSTNVRTGRLPAEAYATPGGYGAVPILWYTGFHGPAAYRSSYGTGSYGGSGYSGGHYGGYGGGK